MYFTILSTFYEIYCKAVHICMEILRKVVRKGSKNLYRLKKKDISYKYCMPINLFFISLHIKSTFIDLY